MKNLTVTRFSGRNLHWLRVTQCSNQELMVPKLMSHDWTLCHHRYETWLLLHLPKALLWQDFETAVCHVTNLLTSWEKQCSYFLSLSFSNLSLSHSLYTLSHLFSPWSGSGRRRRRRRSSRRSSRCRGRSKSFAAWRFSLSISLHDWSCVWPRRAGTSERWMRSGRRSSSATGRVKVCVCACGCVHMGKRERLWMCVPVCECESIMCQT